MQIRCTQKLLRALGVASSELADIEKPNTTLGNWYANIFTLDRRKSIIFVNERTLLSFIIYGVRKNNIDNFPVVFVNGVKRVLTMAGVEEDIINKILQEHAQIFLTKTNSKSLLGTMNDLVNLYSYSILHDGGLNHADLYDVVAKINKTPQRNLDWQNSIDATRELLSTKLH